MQLIEIEIRGAIGIKKGLGVDEIKLDLRNKTGLIALAGPNGRGKTTLLELMSPYRTFASRKGKLSDHFFLRDSFIKRTYLYNGNKYRLEIKIDSESDRTEGFIYVNDSEKSETTGKNKEYDRFIIDLFGSESLFYSSVFCAQNSGNISDMTTGEVKELFVEFLQIGKLVEYETQCKKAISFYDQKREVHETELAGFIKEIEKTTGYESELVMLQDEKKQINENIETSEKTIQDLRDKLEKKKEIQTQNKINTEKKKGIEKDSLKVSSEIGDLNNTESDLTKPFESNSLDLRKELSSFEEILSEKDSILSAADEIKKNQTELDSLLSDLDQVKTKIQEFQTKDNKLRTESDKIQHKIDLLKSDPDLMKLKQSGIDGMNEIVKITSKIKQIDKDIDINNNDSQLSIFNNSLNQFKKTVSFSIDPECKSEICPAIKSIEYAKKSIPEIEHSIMVRQGNLNGELLTLTGRKDDFLSKKENLKTETDKLRDDYIIKNNKIKAELKKLDESHEKQGELISDLYSNNLDYVDDKKVKELKLSIENHKHQIENNQALAEKLPDLKVAESKTEDIKKQIQEKTREFEKKIKELNEKKALKESELKKLNDQVTEIEKTINDDAGDLIDLYKKKIIDAESSLEITRKSISIIDKNIAVTENDLKKKAEYIVLQENQERIISAINHEITEWTYLKLGCSKTGLQALEIDGAAPLITREANTLLELTFGLDFQCEIITQDPETGKEVFWVMVIRGDGSKTEFSLFSGGEKVWIAKALTLGMAIVSRQKSGKEFKTLFADEEDGALDSEKVIKFIELYRSMTKIGYDTCFYISHNETAVSMADHKIDFSSDKLRIV